MRAKFVNEAIKHLTGRDPKKIKKDFVRKCFTVSDSSKKYFVKVISISDDLSVKFIHRTTGSKVHSLPLDKFLRIYPVKINESIKHLTPRSEEEIDKFIPQELKDL